MRLVWPNLIVDRDRATRIRDFVVHRFKDSSERALKKLEARMQGYNKENQWQTVITDAIYFGRN